MLCVKAQLEETLSLRGKLNPIGSQLVVQFRLADGVVNLLFDILVKAKEFGCGCIDRVQC